jgi:DNA-binding LacI/PurR family transcriptional regulator
MNDPTRCWKPKNGTRFFVDAGLRVPEDFAVAILDLHPAYEPTDLWAGIEQCYTECGRATADLLISRMRNNDRGLPEVCPLVLLQGRWVPGRSFPEAGTK